MQTLSPPNACTHVYYLTHIQKHVRAPTCAPVSPSYTHALSTLKACTQLRSRFAVVHMHLVLKLSKFALTCAPVSPSITVAATVPCGTTTRTACVRAHPSGLYTRIEPFASRGDAYGTAVSGGTAPPVAAVRLCSDAPSTTRLSVVAL